MRALKTAFGLLAATVAASALPAVAPAQELIPPGNSAVNQYTETIPTPRGNRNAEGKGKERRKSPEKTLGARNVQRLEEHGSDGRAAAALATDTAPSTSVTEADDEAEAAGGGPRGGGNDGDSAGIASGKPVDRTPARHTGPAAEIPDGSSGFGEVIGEATGSSSSGQLGLLLPLLIVAIAIWSVAYLMRHRRRVE
jgi:hypothetical protein